MEPWLDSLSEDWKSEKSEKSEHPSSPSSLPNGTPTRSTNGSVTSVKSQSRIPHVSQSRAKDSTNGKFLRPRSSRGIARANASPVLVERTSSNLNVTAQRGSSPSTRSQKESGVPTLPRRTSVAFSDSFRSVQHYTLGNKAGRVGNENDTPEWKRRLARGEDLAGNGCDLFGPSRLEGIFKQPSPSRGGPQSIQSTARDQQKPWSMPVGSNAAVSKIDQHPSMRTSRSKILEMDVLKEESEDDDASNDFSPLESEPQRNRSLRGIVKHRVESLELAQSLELDQSPQTCRGSGSLRFAQKGSIRSDPRLRTLSGQEEARNEAISPITVSKQNTIRDRALRKSLDESVKTLQTKFEQIVLEDQQRPSSRSSDNGIQYGQRQNEGDIRAQQEILADITAHSLPDDLSMGTAGFGTGENYINNRRGGYSHEGSFQRKSLSPSAPPSRQPSCTDPTTSGFHSSPPPRATTTHAPRAPTSAAAESPKTPSRPDSGKQNVSPYRLKPASSPLKLFGKHDTVTKNVLERRMSKFEEFDIDLGSPDENESQIEPECTPEPRMTHFGKGDLDDYDFVQHVERQVSLSAAQAAHDRPIFEEVKLRRPMPKPSAQSTSLPRVRRSLRTVSPPAQEKPAGIDAGNHEPKRTPHSPLKDRTPKRRRTFVKHEVEGRFEQKHREFEHEQYAETVQIAGRKRNDARYEDDGLVVDPKVIASRQILRSKTAERQASVTPNSHELDLNPAGIRILDPPDLEGEDITEVIADELANFGVGIAELANDARKPSVTTQDFLNEATKIMQLIRQKGKPKSSLTSVEEPAEESELNPDAILDLDVEGDYTHTTQDAFSRPPSRNGGGDLRRDRPRAQQDPRIISHLRKYQDQDDLELLASTSVLGSIHLQDNAAAEEAALIPVPREEQESSPRNIRILEGIDQRRKRRHSTSTTEGQLLSQPGTLLHTQSSGSSTGRTLPTGSSGSSGRKGMILSGKVAIPDHVGPMTFDHSTKTWIKEQKATKGKRGRQTTSDEDPFDEIPDLSIDEEREAQRNATSQSSANSRSPTKATKDIFPVTTEFSRPQTREHGGIIAPEIGSDLSKFAKPDSSISVAGIGASLRSENEVEPNPGADSQQEQARRKTNTHLEEVEHEIRISEGRISEVPNFSEGVTKQPRVVTIAFSSPLVSAIAYHDDQSTSEFESHLADHSPEKEEVPRICGAGKFTTQHDRGDPKQETSMRRHAPKIHSRDRSWEGKPFLRRPVSRIEEQDEDAPNGDMSLIHISNSSAMTPARHPSGSGLAGPWTNRKTSSVICLTPLADFSLHQADEPLHLEVSYVAQRTHPSSLRQAHGSLALAVDDMVKAITDAQPYEPYWEQIRRLNLAGKKLTTLHCLEEYCSALEELTISDNEIGQLSGLPLGVRTLNAQSNCLSSLTSWGHLQNLQYVDISGNELESLDGFNSLIHLRELTANDNKIREIDGILDLDGLLSLRLRGNELATVDFEGAELTRLTHLDLSCNQLTSFRNVHCLPALEDLNLEQNNLHSFPVSGSVTLRKLLRLKLSHNQFESIDLSAFPSMEMLYLDNNQIRETRFLETARHLDTLSLREQTDSPDIVNHVLSIPTECRKIYLSSNTVPCGTLKTPMQLLPNLQYLELANCGITSVETGFGHQIPNCRVLNLNFNAIKDINPLQGMLRLNKLLLVGNRVTRLRRSCLVFSRFQALTKLDLRDNPLTVGFYGPTSPRHREQEQRLVVNNNNRINNAPSSLSNDERKIRDRYALPPGSEKTDAKWLTLLDEGTRMRRRTIELVLAEGCEMLLELDGLPFDRELVLRPDETWARLTEMGVLRKPRLVLEKKKHGIGEAWDGRPRGGGGGGSGGIC